jgi:hypothetical protein
VNLKSAKYASYVAITGGSELKRGHLMKYANITDIPTYCRGFLAQRRSGRAFEFTLMSPAPAELKIGWTKPRANDGPYGY